MIGRIHEVAELNRLYNSSKAELVAVYGRRRVGKTYLVDEAFKNKITFRHAGLSPVDGTQGKKGVFQSQLKHFYYSLQLHGMKKSHCPESWLEAFFMLETLLEHKDDGGRQVIFLDELPWMDTPRSGFITAFEGFWNTWACHRENILVIVCGSANSWILDKLINNHGGLYNRVTYEIQLAPFTLAECEAFFVSNNVKLSRYDVVQGYMAVGGIPYYLGYFESGKSFAQNMDELFFSKKAKLRDEYSRLFASVFTNPSLVKDIVYLLNTRNAGYTRKEVSEKLGLCDGGTLTSALHALIASDFVVKYIPFGFSKREEHFKLVDSFCKFYLRFVDKQQDGDEGFWQKNIQSQAISAWRGFAFEDVCFNHIRQIKEALGINGVSSVQSAWSKKEDDEAGTQIDLLIDRKDNVINMCEIKFYSGEFTVSKDYHKILVHRQEILSNAVPKKKVVHGTLITTYGLAYNEYSGDFVQVITLDDLFHL